jgi:hypothetical protein
MTDHTVNTILIHRREIATGYDRIMEQSCLLTLGRRLLNQQMAGLRRSAHVGGDLRYNRIV